MISFIKKLTVHTQFLVFNQTQKTYKKNLKETLISVSIKKKSVSQHFSAKLTKSKYSDRNQPEPTKKKKEILRTFLKIQKKKELNPPIYLITKVQFVSRNFRLALPTRKIKKKETLRTFLKIQKKKN